MSSCFRMLRGLQLPRRRHLLLTLVSLVLLSVWIGHWKTKLVVSVQPLLELDRTYPDTAPRQTIHLQTVPGLQIGQQPSEGDRRRHPVAPLPTRHQPAGGSSQVNRQPPQVQPRPAPELHFSRPAAASPYSQVIRLPAGPPPATLPHAKPTIFFWAKSDFYSKYKTLQKPFAGCPQDNCVSIRNRSLVSEADAVIFRMTSGVLPLPPRRPHQRFVFFLMEPSGQMRIRKPAYRGVFNLTMTYRSDSDVLASYFSLRKGAQPTSLPDVGNRSKAAAWFVSHCKTSIGRELYVKELQRFIEVDVYGACGPLRCSRSKESECSRMIAQHYHFYLAFENSRCRDYVTEKLFMPLRYGLVPVVLGDNRTLYERVAPPGSFIHIDDFAGPQQLAEYLHYLMNNRTAFSQYFDWRKRYRVDRSDMWCSLCRYLNEPHPAQYYDDISSWWTDGGDCNMEKVI